MANHTLPRMLPVILGLVGCWPAVLHAGALQIASFALEVTPPLGSPVAYTRARSVDDPLWARGVVLLPEDQSPIVLCAVDFIGIGNEGHLAWRETLARAAETTIDRVAVHALHQHDGPRCDFTAERLFAEAGMTGRFLDERYLRDTLERVHQAVSQAIDTAQPVTHIGIGKGLIEKVASNRRILGPDGKVAVWRGSSTRLAAAIAADEGTIDPWCRCVTFWNRQQPLVALTYYATHPMSYYGKGDVSSDFIGLARNIRDQVVPGLLHVHFNGAGGNIAAGKYNDGSPGRRPVLTRRTALGMHRAFVSTRRIPVEGLPISWSSVDVELPVASGLDEQTLRATLNDPQSDEKTRRGAGLQLAWLLSDHTVSVSHLQLGPVSLLHLPGELFIEFQLAAQQMSPERFVCVAAYGNYAPGYIGIRESYAEGGYEVRPTSSFVDPAAADRLMHAIKTLLDSATTRP